MKISHIGLIAALCILGSCATSLVKREIKSTEDIRSMKSTSKYIKAHMKDGTVYIFNSWRFDSINNSLVGYGLLLDINRNIIDTQKNIYPGKKYKVRPFDVSMEDISLLETNDPGPSIVGGLTIVTGVTAGFGVYCLLNPKACFGSCPTFYTYNGDSMFLQAEGFSSSISPSLEANDIDMLYSAKPKELFDVIVTNEALETHSISYANLLAFEKSEDERVFATGAGLYNKCVNISEPVKCNNQANDCLEKVVKFDGNEYFSSTDPANLNSKEELFIDFNFFEGARPGLIIGKRQTLLTTFLIYQGLAYMGNSVSYWLAELERGDSKYRDGILDLLGGIDIYSKDNSGAWKLEGSVNEIGPIATEFNIIPLMSGASKNVELKIVLNKGLWRIDYLAIANIVEEVSPIIIEPVSVETINGSEPDPLSKLINVEEYLVTYPGDEYKISYLLPFSNAELFLDSKGYYLEWIRDEWVKEQDFNKLNLMFNKPAKYLRKIAPEFKKIESTMEETFWNSKYVKN